MNKIDFAGKRDFAFSTDVGDFMQVATEVIEKLSAFGGENYVLKGCEVNGANTRASGYLVLNNKVVPFLGGTVKTYIKIVETKTTIVVGELTRDETVYHAEFGTTSVSGYQFEWDAVEANKFDDLVDITERLAIAEADLENHEIQLAEKVDVDRLFLVLLNIAGDGSGNVQLVWNDSEFVEYPIAPSTSLTALGVTEIFGANPSVGDKRNLS